MDESKDEILYILYILHNDITKWLSYYKHSRGTNDSFVLWTRMVRKKNSKSIVRFKILKMKIGCPTFFGDGILGRNRVLNFQNLSPLYGRMDESKDEIVVCLTEEVSPKRKRFPIIKFVIEALLRLVD